MLCICIMPTMAAFEGKCITEILRLYWVFSNVMYFIPVMQSWILSITPVFSVTWSFRNHPCWFAAQETFLIFINVENNWNINLCNLKCLYCHFWSNQCILAEYNYLNWNHLTEEEKNILILYLLKRVCIYTGFITIAVKPQPAGVSVCDSGLVSSPVWTLLEDSTVDTGL